MWLAVLLVVACLLSIMFVKTSLWDNMKLFGSCLNCSLHINWFFLLWEHLFAQTLPSLTSSFTHLHPRRVPSHLRYRSALPCLADVNSRKEVLSFRRKYLTHNACIRFSIFKSKTWFPFFNVDATHLKWTIPSPSLGLHWLEGTKMKNNCNFD